MLRTAAVMVILLVAGGCQVPTAVQSEAQPRAETAPAMTAPQAATPPAARAEVVPIKTVVGPDDFPKEWLNAKAAPSMLFLQPREAEYFRGLIATELEKYPPGFLPSIVDSVVLLARLDVGGRGAGGYATRRSVFVVALEDDLTRMTDSDVREVLHHELSSLVAWSKPTRFPVREWLAVNPPGFEYSGWESVEDRSLFEESPELKAEGFIRGYSKTDQGNDFSDIAGALFEQTSGIWEDVKIYPRLAKKVALTVAFYHEVNPTFTEAFFRDIAKSQR